MLLNHKSFENKDYLLTGLTTTHVKNSNLWVELLLHDNTITFLWPVCSHARLCLFMPHETRLHLHARVCVSTCEGTYVSQCVYPVVPWSLSVDLNQPSPVLFAQDMPQEAKTTVRVCPGLRAFLNTPDSCILQPRRHGVYRCFCTSIVWNLLNHSILNDLFLKKNPSRRADK